MLPETEMRRHARPNQKVSAKPLSPEGQVLYHDQAKESQQIKIHPYVVDTINNIIDNSNISSSDELVDTASMSDYATVEVKHPKQKPEEQPTEAPGNQSEEQAEESSGKQQGEQTSSQETMSEKETPSQQEAKGNLPLELSIFQSKAVYWQLVFTMAGVFVTALGIAITIAIFLFNEQNNKIDFYFDASAAKIEDLQELVKEQTSATKEMRKEIIHDVNSRIQLDLQLNNALRERDFILLDREIDKVRQEMNLPRAKSESPQPLRQQD